MAFSHGCWLEASVSPCAILMGPPPQGPWGSADFHQGCDPRENKGKPHAFLWTSLRNHIPSWVCAQLLQSHPTLCDPVDRSPPGSLVHGILQARIVEWVAMPSSRGSSRPGDWTRICLCLLHCKPILYPLSHLGSPINHHFCLILLGTQTRHDTVREGNAHVYKKTGITGGFPGDWLPQRLVTGPSVERWNFIQEPTAPSKYGQRPWVTFRLATHSIIHFLPILSKNWKNTDYYLSGYGKNCHFHSL